MVKLRRCQAGAAGNSSRESQAETNRTKRWQRWCWNHKWYHLCPQIQPKLNLVVFLDFLLKQMKNFFNF